MKKRVLALTMVSIVCVTHPAFAYTVQKGDTLWKISQANHITVQQLMQANHLQSDLIYPGQWLTIPSSGNSPVTKPTTLQDGVFPLPKGTYQPFTDNYGVSRSWSPDGTVQRNHEGVDIYAAKGIPIYSVMNGTVINQGWNEYGGWRLTIRVNASTAFYYAHLSAYAAGITKGATVKKGQLLGYVGNTGYGPVGTAGKFAPHLHFGIYKTSDWSTIDPYPYLKWWQSLQ